ncbi:MAG TPA: winged helix-turn-helix domain-containing protein, partial [Candidatus Sulfotelmatobacter sp.]|nr:winged helix-turn-helix domain-containing protein [Candidatus Sulfotelmatobacter sp.]
ELRNRVWPSDTFVDFDHAINNAINRLREALGDTADTPRYVETVPRRGYRFIGHLEVSKKEADNSIQSVAVLPLENLSRDPEQEYFADGMTEALITSLAKISALRVTSRTTVMKYKSVRDKSSPEVARELGVDRIVEGTVLRSGDRVRISVQLIDGCSDTHLWAESYERDLQDVLALQSEVARAIANEIQVKLTPEEQVQLRRTRRVVAEAYEAYLMGRHNWNKRNPEGLAKGVAYFQQAIDIDPTYAAPYAGLADSQSRLGFFTDVAPEEGCARGKAAALKAIEMDNTLAEGYVALGFASLHYDFDIVAAEDATQQALELDARNALARQMRACCLMARGQSEAAVVEILRAVHLEPLNLALHFTAASFHYMARRYDEAIALSQKAIELDSNFAPLRWAMSLAFVQKQMCEQAVAHMEQAVEISRKGPYFLGSLGHVYAAAGRNQDALRVVDELEEMSKKRHISPYWNGMIYAALPEKKDEAFIWLERAREEHAPWMAYIKAPPWFDNLRSDRRYYSLLQRMKIPI